MLQPSDASPLPLRKLAALFSHLAQVKASSQQACIANEEAPNLQGCREGLSDITLSSTVDRDYHYCPKIFNVAGMSSVLNWMSCAGRRIEAGSPTQCSDSHICILPDLYCTIRNHRVSNPGLLPNAWRLECTVSNHCAKLSVEKRRNLIGWWCKVKPLKTLPNRQKRFDGLAAFTTQSNPSCFFANCQLKTHRM